MYSKYTRIEWRVSVVTPILRCLTMGMSLFWKRQVRARINDLFCMTV